MPASPAERRLSSKIAAHQSWANTANRAARTEAARKALADKFLDQAGGDPIKAEHLRHVHYQRLALRSARARRLAREATAEAEEAEAELGQLGGAE